MDKRTLTLTTGVLLLFLPILPVAAAFHYGAKASEISSSYEAVHKEETYRSESELRYELLVPATKYMALIIGMGGCCPSFEEGDALSATVTAPNGESYHMKVEVGECHSPEGCDNPAHGVEPDFPRGQDWIILVNPLAGKYKVVIHPSGELEEIPPALGWTSAIIWKSYENDIILLGNNIWWYYSDGTKEFKENSGYFGWSEATPRIVLLSVVAMLGWGGSALLLMRVRRLR